MQNLFLNTLHVGRRAVLDWMNKPLVSNTNSKKIPLQKNRHERQCLNSFFESLPAMESHYCRAASQTKYLLPEWSSKKKIYDFYANDWCTRQNVKALSISVFYEEFDNRNLSLFTPKKDQCEICARYSVGNLSVEEYKIHQEKKKKKQEMKKAKTEMKN